MQSQIMTGWVWRESWFLEENGRKLKKEKGEARESLELQCHFVRRRVCVSEREGGFRGGISVADWRRKFHEI